MRGRSPLRAVFYAVLRAGTGAAADDLGDPVPGQGRGAMPVSPGHVGIGDESVDDRFLSRLDDGGVEGVHLAPWDEPEMVVGARLRGGCGVCGVGGFAGVGGELVGREG